MRVFSHFRNFDWLRRRPGLPVPVHEAGCVHVRRSWRWLGPARSAVRLESGLYCLNECLESALLRSLARARSLPQAAAKSHRVPLGLLLLSRQQLTAEQLQAALAAQRSAGCGRIGEWLQALGFVDEQQITAALARQWSCPILRPDYPVRTHTAPPLPVALLERFLMVPFDYLGVTSPPTLYIALAGGPDYAVLYAVETMTGCRTECCLAAPSFVRRNLAALASRREGREVSFACAADTEFCRIIGSYCARIAASEVRLAACGPFVWVRLFRDARPPLDLWMHFPAVPARSPLAGPPPAPS
jgi:hypothetical protein